jgi:hypothetical protein
VEAALDLRAGKTYLYQYLVSIHPFGPKALYKGQIEPYRSKFGDPVFEFLAPNDETAYAYLLGAYQGADTRHLQSARLLESARRRCWATDAPRVPDRARAGC